jgi:hypothetical protein
MITHNDLFPILEALTSVLPFAKPVNKAAALLVWATFPPKAKQDLTPEMLTYAAAQRLMDPDAPKETPIHLSLLRYLYRLENGQPNYEWGLKLDLPQRMAADGQFFAEPISQAHLAATGELPDYDGPRHSPNGVLARLEQAFDDS